MFEIEKKGSVLWWRLNRPDRANAIGTQMADLLLAAAHTLQYEARQPKFSIKTVVLTAAPVQKQGMPGQVTPRTWIGGGDLVELAALRSSEQVYDYVAKMTEVCDILETVPCLTIAAVDGDAIGGGAELALATDLRFATKDARLVFKQLDVGLTTGYGATERLLHLVGKAQTQNLLLRCRSVACPEALELGLFHDAAKEPQDLYELVQEEVNRIDRLSVEALQAQKALIGWDQDKELSSQRREFALQAFTQIWRNSAHDDYLKAFIRRSGESRGSVNLKE